MSTMRHDDAEPVDAPSPSGEQGRYRIIASLGQGGMANIFLAVMSGPAGFSKLLVLKVLRDDLAADRTELATMFLDEARLAARLQHRNLVQTYEFGEIGGRYHISMEYLEGQSLRALQHRIAPAGLPLAEELYVLAETARGLHYAHEVKGFDGVPLSVVHRDISPQNVFVTYDGEVKLLDFGIAKIAGAAHATQVGVIKGKVDYIAPEQVRGDSVDRRADIFSLGAMLWEAITKDRFGGGTKIAEVTKFHKRLTGGEPNVRAVTPDVPEALASIVDRAVALDPSQRFATAQQFADSIKSYLDTLPARPNERSLADLLARHFSDEREKLRKRIELQLQRIHAKDQSSARLRSGFRTLDTSLTMTGVLDLSALGDTASTNAIAASPPRESLARPRAIGWAVPAIVASISLLSGVAVSYLVDGRHDSREAAADSAPSPAAPAPASPAGTSALPSTTVPVVERTVAFSVNVSPSDARVLLDGVSLPTLPFVGSFRLGSEAHLLQASAPGFEDGQQFITFERDQALQIELRARPEPLRAHTRRSAAAPVVDATVAHLPSAPHPVSTLSEELEPGAELKTKPRQHHFDTTDPYAD